MLRQQLLDTDRGRMVSLLLTVDDIASKREPTARPLHTQLVDVFTNGLQARQVDALLREAGRKLAREPSSGRPTGTLRSR